MTEAAAARGTGRRAWIALLAAVGLVVWVLPMGRSLWLDETLTWWVDEGGLGQAVHRAFTYQQSPLYYVLVWPFAHLGVRSEALLRVPSLLAAIVTAILVWRLAVRLIGPGAGGVAVLVLMGTWATVEAYDARPYALALACAVGATLALVELLDHPNARAAVLYGVLAAATVWAHYLFVAALLPHAVYLAARLRAKTTTIGWRVIVLAVITGVVLLIPLAAQVVSLWDRRRALSTGGESALLAPFLIANVVAIPAIVIAAIATRGRLRFRGARPPRQAPTLMIAWAVVPPIALWLVSALSAPYFINGRYLVSATPGVALLIAWGASALVPPLARRVFVIALAVLTPLTFILWFHRSDDWRDAVATAAGASTQDTVVLARVRLVEAKQVDWLTEPEQRSYLQAPFSFYPLPNEPLSLPLFPHDAGADVYLDGLLSTALSGHDRFLLIEQGDVYGPWLQQRLGPLGWTSRQVGTVDEPQVTEFTRTAA